MCNGFCCKLDWLSPILSIHGQKPGGPWPLWPPLFLRPCSMNRYSNIQIPRKYCTVIQGTKLMHIPGCTPGFKFKQTANK